MTTEVICFRCGAENPKGVDLCRTCWEDLREPTINWKEVFRHYQRQEKELIDFFEYVPYETKHFNVHSPKLFDLYLQIGAGIEQQLRYIYQYFHPNKAIPKKVRETIGCCYKPMKLKKMKIFLIYPENDSFFPFYSINITNENRTVLRHFQLYSKYKHEWVELVKMTTLERTVRFLSMYFILLCLNPSIGNLEFLRDNDILHLGYSYDETLRPRKEIDGHFLNRYREYLTKYPKERQHWPSVVIYESAIFNFSIDLNNI